MYILKYIGTYTHTNKIEGKKTSIKPTGVRVVSWHLTIPIYHSKFWPTILELMCTHRCRVNENDKFNFLPSRERSSEPFRKICALYRVARHLHCRWAKHDRHKQIAQNVRNACYSRVTFKLGGVFWRIVKIVYLSSGKYHCVNKNVTTCRFFLFWVKN